MATSPSGWRGATAEGRGRSLRLSMAGELSQSLNRCRAQIFLGESGCAVSGERRSHRPSRHPETMSSEPHVIGRSNSGQRGTDAADMRAINVRWSRHTSVTPPIIPGRNPPSLPDRRLHDGGGSLPSPDSHHRTPGRRKPRLRRHRSRTPARYEAIYARVTGEIGQYAVAYGSQAWRRTGEHNQSCHPPLVPAHKAKDNHRER